MAVRMCHTRHMVLGVAFLVPNAAFLVEGTVFMGLSFGLWGLALWDLLHRSKLEVSTLGPLPRPVWVALLVVTGPVGALTYLLYSRLRLRGRPRLS